MDAPLSEEQTFALFEKFLNSGPASVPDEEIKNYLLATSLRLPSGAELVGAARSLRSHMLKLDTSALPANHILIDTCGTGGSGKNTFNTSTAAAVVAAAGGLFVAKHGNRAVSSKCGSADLLEALGTKISADPSVLSEWLAATNFTFLFAPNFHPATKRVQGIRRELNKRTIFNFLGPLVNPAGVKRQLLGVSNQHVLEDVAEALLHLGADSAMVVCGEDGLDEITLCAPTEIWEIRGGKLSSWKLTPEQFGLRRADFEQISGATSALDAADALKKLLSGKRDARYDLVILNSGAAFYISGAESSIEAGMKKAEDLITSGAAAEALERILNFTASHDKN